MVERVDCLNHFCIQNRFECAYTVVEDGDNYRMVMKLTRNGVLYFIKQSRTWNTKQNAFLELVDAILDANGIVVEPGYMPTNEPLVFKKI